MKNELSAANFIGQFLQLAIRLCDVGLVLLIAEILFFAQNGVRLISHYYLLIVICFVFQQIIFSELRVYYNLFEARFLTYLSSLFIAWSFVCTALVVTLYFTKTSELVSRFWLGSWYFTCMICFFCVHFLIRYWFFHGIKHSSNQKNVLLFGAGKLATKTVAALKQDRLNKYKIDCVFDDDAALIEENFSEASIKGSLLAGIKYIKKHQEPTLRNTNEQHAAEIWITLPMRKSRYLESLLNTVQDTTYSVHYVPDLTGVNLLNSRVTNVGDFNVFTLIDDPFKGVGLVSKMLQDKILALLLLFLAFPVMLVVALLIKLDSPGPVIFKQTRYGVDGKEIKVWKFRSMYSCEENVLRQARRDDARITPIGRFIRRTSLDELPQLFNVLFGQMSLVGPRPHAVNHNEEYRGKIRGYMMRHKLKPGITGWAQVNGWRGETDVLDKMEKRVECDLYYIRNWSTLFDLKIIFMTIKSIFIGSNAY